MNQAESMPQSLALTIEQALQQAITHHQAGRLPDAERLYRVVLRAQPHNPDANHNLGVLAGQVGQHLSGIPYLRTALAVKPAEGQFSLSYAEALLVTGQVAEALTTIANAMQRGLNGPAIKTLLERAQAMALNGNTADPARNRDQSAVQPMTPGGDSSTELVSSKKNKAIPGRPVRNARSHSKMPSPQESIPQVERTQLVALFNAGRFVELENRTRLLVQHYPDSGFAWKALGSSLQMQGKEALPALQTAAELLPNDAETHFNLSVALQAAGQFDSARANCCRALEIRPDFADAFSNLGNAFLAQGQIDPAMAAYRRALEIKPESGEAHNNMGNALQALGQFDRALVSYRTALAIKPTLTEALGNLGATLQTLGQIDSALASCRRAIALKPDYAEAHNNLGNTLQTLGQFDEAAASCRWALEIKPQFAEAYSNLGNALQALGQFDEAAASCRRALEIKPEFAEAHSNLGGALKDLGKLDVAVTCYRRALGIKPDLAEAHSNLGGILRDLGQLDDAVLSYRRAMVFKPDFAVALNNLAFSLNEQGESRKALGLVCQSLRLKETWEAKSIFVTCIKDAHPSELDHDVWSMLVRALAEPWTRPEQLGRIAAEFVKLNSAIGRAIARATQSWPLPLPEQTLFEPGSLATVAADPLLAALLGSMPICDVDLERFITMVRGVVLDAACNRLSPDCDIDLFLAFSGAVARQCFINEYTFAHTASEIQTASDLRDSLAAALETNAQVPAIWLVAVAAYYPLGTVRLSNRLLKSQWPDAVMSVLMQQVCAPEEELQLRATIPRLTVIEDEISLLVQNQYEENPYPRWIMASPAGKSKSIDGYMRRRFPLTNFQPFGNDRTPDILVAGCGTGQHPIETARQFSGARVLAIDLSLTSLCYAKRKTQELGLTSIDYAQADILKLGSIERSFDIIESAGVLHHLVDPWEGWQVLLSLLRPGGFMRLGFYSEVARRDIVKARSFVAERGYASSAEDIRQCRQDLMNLEEGSRFGSLLRIGDMYSISGCRDLIFHVQEHRMTLTDIEGFLLEHGLQFLGFEIDSRCLHAYRLRFPGDRPATNLSHWQVFENENPDTFISMYQFWVQKGSGP